MNIVPTDQANSISLNAIVEIRISKADEFVYNISLKSDNKGVYFSEVDGIKAVYFRGVIEKELGENFTIYANAQEAWMERDGTLYFAEGGEVDPTNYDIVIYALLKRDEDDDITTQFLNCVLDWH